MSSQQPIGVFDSGVGGLSVLRHVRDLLPDERLLYVADSAYMPYGSLTLKAVEERCHRIAGFFAMQGAKAVVVACNTATAAAIEALRRDFPLPIIGMEPAVKPAVEATKAGVIGVLATSGTLASEKFSGLVKRFGSSAEVIFQPGSGLVELVEAGEFDSPRTRELLEMHLLPLLERGADVLVLGCTHYPFLTPVIREIVGSNVTILDTGDAIALELKRQLIAGALTASEDAIGSVLFFSSGDLKRNQSIISHLWGSDVAVNNLGNI
ncbi:glutamate racemase [Pseudomonadota bacterium]